MKKQYDVKENNKIEDGKKRLVPEPSKCTEDVTDYAEINKMPQELLDTTSEPKVEYRPATSKDMVFDKEVQVRSPEGDYSHDLRVVEVINPYDSLKAFIASDGHIYGLELTFVKVTK